MYNMKTEDLLVSYPRATQTVREWFLKEMLKSFEDDQVPEDFKEAMRIQGIPNGQLFKLIDAQPRILFDVFDENGIYIDIHVNMERTQGPSFHTTIAGEVELGWKPDRKSAEVLGIQRAFQLLEENLTPLLDDDAPLNEADGRTF